MNVIFLSSLEKPVAEDRILMAQVTIGEEHGTWRVFWSEPGPSGKPEQTVWFEGSAWNEMLTVFRQQLGEKLREGYVPLIETASESTRGGSARQRYTLMMHYYGELRQVPEAYEQLRLWRRGVAEQENKSAYFVASNRVLRMLAAFLPHTLEELLQIPGLGENRAKRYEAGLLAITREYARETTFPLDWVESAVDAAAFDAWLGEERQRKERQESERRSNKRKLLEAIGAGQSLAELHKLMAMKRTELMDAVEELARDGYDVDTLIERELNEADPELLLQADVLFRELGDRYLKPVLRKLFSDEELAGKDVNRLYEWLRLYRLQYRRRKAG